jgi:CRISPR-associated endonuclease Cas1
MREVKTVNLVLDSYGSYLGVDKGCILVRDANRKEKKYPLFESAIGEIVLKSGSVVTTGALSALSLWGVDVLIMTRNDRPIALLKNLEDDSHVETRISQYESLRNGKGIHVAKRIIYAKALGQNQVLKKYGLRQHDLMHIKENIEKEAGDLASVRKRLTLIESHYSKNYFQEIFKLFPQLLRPQKRHTFHAYDAINNLFNFGYDLLFWKCYKALTKAHLETHLGFMHTLIQGRPSLVCDYEEVFRYLVDDFLIGYAKGLTPKDFKARTVMFNNKKGKRMYLNESKTDDLMKKLHEYFESKVDVPRVGRGHSQEIESLIGEEAFLLARYFRNEKGDWTPRVVSLS